MDKNQMRAFFGIETGDEVDRHYIGLAADAGVTLTVVDYGDWKPAAPIYEYAPPNEDWPTLHLQRMLYSWRISEVEIPGATYARSWDYDGTTDADFMRAVLAIAVWQGGEPKRWDKALGG